MPSSGILSCPTEGDFAPNSANRRICACLSPSRMHPSATATATAMSEITPTNPLTVMNPSLFDVRLALPGRARIARSRLIEHRIRRRRSQQRRPLRPGRAHSRKRHRISHSRANSPPARAPDDASLPRRRPNRRVLRRAVAHGFERRSRTSELVDRRSRDAAIDSDARSNGPLSFARLRRRRCGRPRDSRSGANARRLDRRLARVHDGLGSHRFRRGYTATLDSHSIFRKTN